MAKLTKRIKMIREHVVAGKQYSVEEAIEILKKVAKVKFDESVDVAINLGIDARKSDQLVRGATILPNGTGRQVRVAVFAQGDLADKAREAGADIVGFEDLAEKVKQGEMNFDVVVATPDAMKVVGQLGQVLGPRGLMPNPKVGTVTQDVVTAVKNAKGGQIRYRTDKAGILHCSIGKVSFAVEQIKQNLQALLTDVKKAKPATLKGIYIRKLTLSTTMGPGLLVELASVN